MRVVIVGPVRRVIAATAVARARDRAVARASLEEWRPFPIPHARRLATAIVPYLRRLATAIPHLSPDPDGVFDRLNPNARALGDGILFIDFSFVTVYRVSECVPAIFQCNRWRYRRYSRVSGRGTDRDAACGDVIMNDDQAKKLKQTTTARRSSFSSTISTLLAALAFLDDYFLERIPLPLYGSGGRLERMIAAKLPTQPCRSRSPPPRCSTALHRDALRNFMMTGGSNPRERFKSSLASPPCNRHRGASLLLETGRNPDHHVVGERAVQAVALAHLRESLARPILIAPSSSANTIVSGKDISKLPSDPVYSRINASTRRQSAVQRNHRETQKPTTSSLPRIPRGARAPLARSRPLLAIIRRVNIFVLSRIVRHTVVFARTFTARWLP